MIGKILLVFLLIIFTLGGIAIMLCQLNILWRNYFGSCRNNRHIKPLLSVQPLALKVVKRYDITQKHFSVRLAAVNGNLLTSFLPGQYLTLMTPKQSEQTSTSAGLLKRCYSLASWQENTAFYELGIQREKHGKMSTWLHRHLQVGTVINVLPPKGNFVINAKESFHAVLVAGGIGITPLRAMVHQFIAQHNKVSSVNKSMSLFYSAKTAEEMCYLDEFIQLANECSNFMFYPFLTRGASVSINYSSSDHAKVAPTVKSTMGRLSAVQLTQKLELYLNGLQSLKVNKQDRASFHYYLCGPNVMMDELKYGLIQQGIAKANINFERFGIDNEAVVEQKFSVKLGKNKKLFFHKQRNLLDAMEEQGIKIQSECRSGECGQCKVNLRYGKVKSLIEIDMNLKAGEILPCCSVPESDLHIDL